jgi:2-polyprenyl-3-methyl-5-hydroxy-6-metoxy-1,4-benzoquinol methylase
MTELHPSANEVISFYDEFLERRMLDYRLRPNKRLEMAFDAIRPLIDQGSGVADIGCGIGIVSEKIAKTFPKCKVVGVDISKANIEYAKKTVSIANVEFFAADVTDQIEVLKSASPEPFGTVVLVDVIEHVPEYDRAGLLADLAEISREGALLFLAYPSPEYQDFLRVNDPDELQVIDNNVAAEQLVREASDAGWLLRSFGYKDIWRAGQYVHATFVKGQGLGQLQPVQTPFTKRIRQRLLYTILRPFRYQKYIYKPFQDTKG